MSTQVQNINKVNSGLCPHGLPPSACPICSKISGGGGLRAGERPQKAGEMSYHECVVIGNLMKARKLAEKRHLQQLENQTEALKNFERISEKMITNLQNYIQNLSSKTITRPMAYIIRMSILPILNLIKFLPKILNQIQNLKFEIQDKLNAIWGEAKNFIQRKVSELISIINIKLKKLFKISKKDETNNDDNKIDDDKKIFNLKNIIKKIRKKHKKDDNNHKN